MNNHNYTDVYEVLLELFLVLPFVIALFIYPVAVLLSNRHYKRWPLYRTACWLIGVLCAIISIVDPLANHAHNDFKFHMVGHLLLGMLAPLLMVLAAPMTLFLRTLHVKWARQLIRELKSWPCRFLSDPIVASLLNIGGLWILYTTDLYAAMLQNSLLHLLIHKHVFLAGYLFTISMIYIDPTPHRRSFIYRGIVFVIALASHQILSKYIYAYPPTGVSTAEAEIGGMLMYYGGDAIDMMIILIFCRHWYKATRPRVSVNRTIGS